MQLNQRRNNLARPSEIKKANAARKVDNNTGEREKRLGVKRLVQSEEYRILKLEANRIALEHFAGPPKDGNSLIAFISGALIQCGFSMLFNRLEKQAADIPDAQIQTTRKTEN